MINHLTSTYARNWGLTRGVGVWLKVYLQELMVHVSVRHVLSLGYKFIYGVQALFFFGTSDYCNLYKQKDPSFL